MFSNKIPEFLLKTALLCLAVFFVINFSCKREENLLTIIIEDAGLNYPVKLLRVDTSGMTPVDSLIDPVDRNFSFTVPTPYPSVFVLTSGTSGVEFIGSGSDSVTIGLSSGKITVEESNKYASFRNYVTRKKELEKRADSLATLFEIAQLHDSFPMIRESINREFDNLLLQTRQLSEGYIYNNHDSPGIFYAITAALRQTPVFNYVTSYQVFNLADSVMQRYNPENPYTVWLQNFVLFNKRKYGDRIKPVSAISLGDTIPTIILPGFNDQLVKVKPEENEVALIYFWNESPESRKATEIVKYLNETYSMHGLKVYAIAVIESKKDWRSLVELNKMWWINMQDSDNHLLTRLKAGTIPYFIITDSSKIVMAHFANPLDLREWVTAHFQKVNEKH